MSSGLLQFTAFVLHAMCDCRVKSGARVLFAQRTVGRADTDCVFSFPFPPPPDRASMSAIVGRLSAELLAMGFQAAAPRSKVVIDILCKSGFESIEDLDGLLDLDTLKDREHLSPVELRFLESIRARMNDPLSRHRMVEVRLSFKLHTGVCIMCIHCAGTQKTAQSAGIRRSAAGKPAGAFSLHKIFSLSCSYACRLSVLGLFHSSRQNPQLWST